ncbi:zinc finger protein 708-like isoform X2 [Cynoglossus semilaevis]|uniref:zinc finger protein 708-like isoform X2 n=1 Tax=Cynoglossus semilaevis TaxID=244447 RepID=UPI0007DCA9C9|nr:zinc finger protein 708-like isoform X2 [Cynoglossus semilaevis]
MEPSAGGGAEHLCVLLLGAEEVVTKREVACQWESQSQQSKEVACQSDWAEQRDVGVPVDLLTHQLGWANSTSSTMLLECFSVRPDGSDGGALLQHCTSRTRTRTIKPAIRLSPTHESKSHRREPQSRKMNNPGRKRQRGRPRLSCRTEAQEEKEQPQDKKEEEAEVQEEQAQEEEEEEEQEQMEKDDPNWIPSKQVEFTAKSLERVNNDLNSQHAPEATSVKLEMETIMCDVCGKVMKNKSSLARHSFIHTGKKPFACHLCDLRFNRRDNLQHHLSKLHPNGVARLEKQRAVQAWLCAVCGKTFSCRSRLKAHEIIHSGVKPYRCDLCSKAYMRTNDLEHHKKIVHVEGGKEPRPSLLLCDFCGKEFKCRSQLHLHLQTHTGERPHLCDICGRKFARPHQLKRHKILIHSNQVIGEENLASDSSYTCSVCGKRLKSEAHLMAHSHVHTDDRPHRCSICLRSFQRVTWLKQHHMRVHLKVRVCDAARGGGRIRKSTSQTKAFPCPVCCKVFKFKSLLESHSLIHSEVRPYACDFCNRRFRRRSHLKRHREVVHANGERAPQSFVCHICGKDKKCRSQLDRHVIIHTGERPFACDLCPARFNRRGNLQQHLRRMHGVGKQQSQEDPPILFEDDMMLTYKQEETVVAIETAAETFEANDDAAEQLVAS